MLAFIKLVQHYPKMDGAIFISSFIKTKRTNIITSKVKIKKSFLLIEPPPFL